jgi:hypothetical protein
MGKASSQGFGVLSTYEASSQDSQKKTKQQGTFPGRHITLFF